MKKDGGGDPSIEGKRCAIANPRPGDAGGLRIACLAWGSLVWKAGPLRLASAWQVGGPSLPIEFGRVGDAGELATAICPGAAESPTRWALLATGDLDAAREMLREREGIHAAEPHFVGSVPARHGPFACASRIEAWASSHGLDAVVWTALPPRFAGSDGRSPSLAESLAYLHGLRGAKRMHAERYVRQVPAEIDTPYRRAFAAALGWQPFRDA